MIFFFFMDHFKIKLAFWIKLYQPCPLMSCEYPMTADSATAEH